MLHIPLSVFRELADWNISATECGTEMSDHGDYSNGRIRAIHMDYIDAIMADELASGDR